MWLLISLIICIIISIVLEMLSRKYKNCKRASRLQNIIKVLIVLVIILNSFLIIGVIIKMHTSGFTHEYEFINTIRQDTSHSDVE